MEKKWVDGVGHGCGSVFGRKWMGKWGNELWVAMAVERGWVLGHEESREALDGYGGSGWWFGWCLGEERELS